MKKIETKTWLEWVAFIITMTLKENVHSIFGYNYNLATNNFNIVNTLKALPILIIFYGIAYFSLLVITKVWAKINAKYRLMVLVFFLVISVIVLGMGVLFPEGIKSSPIGYIFFIILYLLNGIRKYKKGNKIAGKILLGAGAIIFILLIVGIILGSVSPY
ncbi:MAG TPA: hypothetical protein VIK72_03000 [Clostridiaceae bacterium]